MLTFRVAWKYERKRLFYTPKWKSGLNRHWKWPQESSGWVAKYDVTGATFLVLHPAIMGFLGVLDGKESCLQCRRPGFDSWIGKIPQTKE